MPVLFLSLPAFNLLLCSIPPKFLQKKAIFATSDPILQMLNDRKLQL